MSPQYFIAPAGPSDLEELVRLVNSAYRGETSRRGWTTEADLFSGQRTDVEQLRRVLSQAPRKQILTLRENTGAPLLGCVLLERFEDDWGIGCYLGMLTVRPDLQAQGIGKILLAQAENVARSWQASRIVLGVIHLRDTLMAW